VLRPTLAFWWRGTTLAGDGSLSFPLHEFIAPLLKQSLEWAETRDPRRQFCKDSAERILAVCGKPKIIKGTPDSLLAIGVLIEWPLWVMLPEVGRRVASSNHGAATSLMRRPQLYSLDSRNPHASVRRCYVALTRDEADARDMFSPIEQPVPVGIWHRLETLLERVKLLVNDATHLDQQIHVEIDQAIVDTNEHRSPSPTQHHLGAP
jgi:hypothetical protein